MCFFPSLSSMPPTLMIWQTRKSRGLIRSLLLRSWRQRSNDVSPKMARSAGREARPGREPAHREQRRQVVELFDFFGHARTVPAHQEVLAETEGKQSDEALGGGGAAGAAGRPDLMNSDWSGSYSDISSSASSPMLQTKFFRFRKRL